MRYIDWILPLNVKNTLKKYFQKEAPVVSKVEEKIEINPLLERNKVLNNSVGENKTCYILACGPSINEMDLSILKGEDCISVSNFFVHPLYNEIQPKYHVFAQRHEPITEEQLVEWFKDFAAKTSFESKLIFSAKDFCSLEEVVNKGGIESYCYELTDELPENFDQITFENPIPRIQTVVHIAMYLAISLGYKEINLLGVDHDWLFHFGESRHFYKEKESKLNQKGYEEFHSENDLELQFKSHLLLWKVYKSIKRFSIEHEIQVFNLNMGSFLDVFPKKKIGNEV